MRIISSFKDYYDCIQNIDREKEPVYIRTQKEYNCECKVCPPYIRNKNFGNSIIDCSNGIIGFCGKIYLFIRLKKSFNNYLVNQNEETCYSIEQVDTWIENNFESKEVNEYKTNRIKQNSWKSLIPRKTFENMFKKIKEVENNYYKLFNTYNTPILHIHSVCRKEDNYKRKPIITTNPLLNCFKFYRLFNPTQAFSEISMFLNNLARPIKPIPEIPDEMMVEIKGFDKKFSFRKEKQHK